LVSNASSAACQHDTNSLVHDVGDVATLAAHFTLLHNDRQELARLREGCLRSAPDHTWEKAGERLVEAYAEVLAGRGVRV
jgi:hypothetical protein